MVALPSNILKCLNWNSNWTCHYNIIIIFIIILVIFVLQILLPDPCIKTYPFIPTLVSAVFRSILDLDVCM